jgi:hypothetical protein
MSTDQQKELERIRHAAKWHRYIPQDMHSLLSIIDSLQAEVEQAKRDAMPDWEKMYYELKDQLDSKWISVKDRLPPDAKKEDDKAYLVFPHYEVAGWWDGSFWFFDECDEVWEKYNTVTHWQLLPQPPKEKDTK